jgi:PIN domain nuclease of toxin-antitoxin system
MIVLDSSALLAMLLEETGADTVARHLGDSMMSTVNLCEVLAVAHRTGQRAERLHDALARSPIDFRDFDVEQAAEAALLEPLTRTHGLSLGDRACLALAILSRIPVLTADRAWAGLDLPVAVEVIR